MDERGGRTDPGPADRAGAAGAVTGFETWASRAVGGVPQLVRRVPFTGAVVCALVLVGLVSRTVWRPLWRESWFHEVAYGVPALREGKVWTFVVGWFFTLNPVQFVGGVLLFAVLVGACELRLGTKRAALVAVIGQFAGITGASLLVWALSTTSWTWAQHVAQARDVGFTTGALAVVAVTSATLRSPWRLRVRAALWFYATVAFLFEGTLTDVSHGLAVFVGMVVGQRLWGVEPGYAPRTRRETRILAFGGMLALVFVELVVLLFPGHGPFGETSGDALPLLDVLIDLVLVGFVANQLRYGKRWAWWVAVVLGALNVLGAAFALLFILLGELPEGAPVALSSGLLWLGELALLLFNRGSFRVPLRRRLIGGVAADELNLSRARGLLTDVGGSTMSWMTVWPENRFYFTLDGRGYVGYQRHAGVAIALADPVVPAGTAAEAVREFAAMSEHGGLVPCLFSVTDEVARAARADGWQTVQIAEDTVVDLPELSFKGKKWQDIRTALNHAKRDGLEFRLVRLADEPFAILAQVRAISEQWVGDKGLPEMGFTLGGVDEALDPRVWVGLAIDGTGSVHGVTSWLPVFGPGGQVRGWTLDVMRRRTDGFRPVMEFMIASACLELRERGARFVSLSGAPLARGGSADLEGVDRVLDKLGGAMEPLYGFRSLHAFKAKFSPRYEPVHLAYRDEADLPRIGLALLRAYLPDASTRQILAASFSKP
ncbi:bifunctional lysylphosphatidylglycerol flippase/synthetase MprF [Saccharothrix espanaensis]|uniref:Phosphatidylglycerol lysyltransferase C-terminal domain-containing protein n=1 Tax=Saccharothrix espanaensis (strain ATCC 51144 / DSM 44229 / JCM 9112 / NBRC 15066 / NRRL 15764) TaxID=1179773 RepID=K0K255_SACES|nr:hypothetical protein BN6_36590 [Saccharothrix espanaensis DSM 44229]